VARSTRRRPPLADYQAKRDFARTPEPAGDARADGDGGGPMFVVQRHRARRLHYDLRLEVDGVLASWAVPKGPTLDPGKRHLAVHVEDHPMEYADFEGVIPSGEYGGGDVIVWDRGTWEPSGTDDPAAAIAAGELHFDLQGEKLSGRSPWCAATARAAVAVSSGCSCTRTTTAPRRVGTPRTIPLQ
jgi:bifunctional non-homologous end joining protein LigD